MDRFTSNPVNSLSANTTINGISAQHLQRLMRQCNYVYTRPHYIEVRPHQYKQLQISRPYAVCVHLELLADSVNRRRLMHALNKLDDYFVRQLRTKYYIRSTDSVVILCRDKAAARQMLARVTSYASQNTLRTSANCRIRPLDSGISFAGYIVFAKHLRLGTQLKRLLPQIAHRYELGQISYDVFKRAVAAWLALSRIADPDDYYAHKALSKYWDQLALGPKWF